MPVEVLGFTHLASSPETAWPANTGTRTSAVALPHDDSASYISDGTVFNTSTYTLNDPVSVSPSDTITSVVVYFRGKFVTFNDTLNVVFHLGETSGTSSGVSLIMSSYTTFSVEFDEDFNGNPWTYSNLLDARITLNSTDSNICQLTSIWAEVYYTAGGGGGGGEGGLHLVPLKGAGLL